MQESRVVRVRLAIWVILAAAVAPALSCRTAGLRRAYTALDSQGDRRRTIFFTDTESIYCIGELVSARDDVTVHARIKSVTRVDPSGQSVPYEQIYAEEEIAPGKTNLTLAAFPMQKAPPGLDSAGSAPQQGLPYPVGTFVCELTIDGSLEETVNFSIAYPGCPTVPVLATVPCRGWVKTGSVCPSVVPGSSCTCSAQSGNWECGP